jgi:hypothetical protein
MEEDEPLYGPNFSRKILTTDERAFNDLQDAVAKSIQASKKYKNALSKRAVTRGLSRQSEILKAKLKKKTSLMHALTKAQILHNEAKAANNTIYIKHAAKYMETASQQLHKLQLGGSRRRRIKSARKKSKRHKKTHHRK